jgi:tellurite resistance protein TehA-like permease
MYKEVLQSIKGADIYAIISLFIFIVFFIVIVVRLLRMDKSYLKKMENLPLESENNSQNLKGESHEI